MRHIRTALVLLGLATALAIVPAAGAGSTGDSANGCGSQQFEQPFTHWLDPFNYVLAPGGTLEEGAGSWQLRGSSVVAGNEPFYVHAAGESRSLSIPSGATATTQPMCITLLHPDLRFLARNTGSALGLLKVEVLVGDGSGQPLAVPFALVPAGKSWAPTLPLPFVVNALSALSSDGTTSIAFRFTSTLGGSFQIDDVYVDPYRSA